MKILSFLIKFIFSGSIFKLLTRDGYPGVFNDKKCLFIHVPKAAGSSVCMELFGYQTGHKSYFRYWLDSPAKADSYFKFTFVRNPYDRLVSAYHFLKAGGMDQRDKTWAEDNLSEFESFEDFVKNWVTPSNIAKKNHFQTQLSFLCAPRSKVPKVDFIGRIENFNDDMNIVRARLGLALGETVHVNQSERKDYRSYYTDEMLSIVRRVYADDIEILGYDIQSKRKL